MKVRRYAGWRWPSLPRPFVFVLFEWQTLGFEVGIYTPRIEGSLVYAGIDFELPADVADALVVVWPGELAEGARGESLRRLLRRES